MMARSEAQKRADARYRAKHNKDYGQFSTMFRKQELEEIKSTIKAHGMTKAQFIRIAIKELF